MDFNHFAVYLGGPPFLVICFLFCDHGILKRNLLIDIFLEIMGGYSQYYKVKQMKQPNESFYKHLIISSNINCKAILLDLLEEICMLGASEYSDLEFSKLIILYRSWIEPSSDSSLNDRSDP